MTVLETVVIPFNYIPIIMEESGFEPPNPKERFYRPSRLTRLRYSSIKWRGTESNRRHTELQSVALPTELPSRAWSGFTTYRCNGGYRARTCDPLLVRQMLSQLS